MSKQKKESLNKKFHPDDVKGWQECADKKFRGNLTRWMEDVLNRAAGKELKSGKAK